MEETEEDYISRILRTNEEIGMATDPSQMQMNQPAGNYYMDTPAPEFGSPPPMQPNAVNTAPFPDVVFRSRSRNIRPREEVIPSLDSRNAGIGQPTRQENLTEQKLPPIEGFEKRTNVLAPFGTSVTKSFSPMMSPEQETQNQVQPISKQEQATPKDNYFRESVGGILVALGAGFQGADASKALERYNSAIQNDKDEARRQAIEQERKRKLDPSSQGNIAFRTMFEKYLPGVREMMGKNYDSMTEEMLKSSYPMIANGIKAATEKELSNPASASSIDAVKSYNQMISVFGGKVPLLKEGTVSAKEVDRITGNIDNFLRYSQNEATNKLNERKFTEDLRVNQQTQDLQNKKFNLELQKEKHAQSIDYANLKLRKDQLAYQKERDAEARKQAALLQQKNSEMSAKEARRIAEKYPYGVMLKDQESNELIKKSNAYNKMKSALDNLEKGILQYGAPANPMSDGYRQVDALWSTYMLAVKDAEEMGALDKGVEGAANRTLMNPVNMNLSQRISGGEKRVKEDALSILKEKRDSYKKQYAKNTSNYGFNPELSAQENTRLMDEYINPNTPKERQQQIYLQNFKNLGYDPSLFTKYAENYETRRKILTGGY